MGNNKDGKANRAARAAQLIAGTRKHFTNGSQALTYVGSTATVTVDAAVAQLQTLIDNRAATTGAQATARAKVAAERAQMPALAAFMKAFEAIVRVMLGASVEALADFGLAPPKVPAPRTAEQKAVAAARRKATREARGTKGPKQKKGIHGNVTAQLVVTPEGSSAAPAPAAAPATPGGSGTPPTPHTGS